jgi:hypothetical protein
MGFKVDESFLRFLTMGAVSAKAVADEMRAKGLRPIELERQSTSNKIWATKIKRMRLPDLLCLKTGVRVEVRAKSKLAIRMSDAPGNPDRVWNAGLNDDDLVVFVKCSTSDASDVTAQSQQAFTAGDVAACDMELTKLGPPKSASEGSERDRTWPTVVPSKSGKVIAIHDDKLVTLLDSGKQQTYGLRGFLTPYVAVGERFEAGRSFLAGLPKQRASLPQPGRQWNPRPLLNSSSSIDRYVAVKALGHLGTAADIANLANLAVSASDSRVSLEAGVALARLGDDFGLVRLATEVGSPSEPYLAMEAVLALAELSGSPLQSEAANLLSDIANDAELEGAEVRQAAIWGLGFTGLQAYDKLLPFLSASNQSERVHALVAMGNDFDVVIVNALARMLSDPNSSDELAAAAADILSQSRRQTQVINAVLPIAKSGAPDARAWALAVLGALPRAKVDPIATAEGLSGALRPLQLLSPSSNWTRGRRLSSTIGFVRQQALRTLV